MKLVIVVGDVELRLVGLDVSKRQVVDLLRETAGIAVAFATAAPSSPDEPDPRPHIGFTAHLDLDPERNVADDLSEWFEESP